MSIYDKNRIAPKNYLVLSFQKHYARYSVVMVLYNEPVPHHDN